MKYFKRYDFLSITVILSLWLIGSVVNAQSMNSLSYVTSYQQKSLMIEKGMNLDQALKLIGKRFDVVFLYRSDVMRNKKITKTLYLSHNIHKALKKLLKGKKLVFKHTNYKTYGIYLKENARYAKETISQKQQTVSGTVTDDQTGNTLPGVNILVKGTSSGTSTDTTGHYSLNVSSMQDTLVFSYIGYKKRIVPINGRSMINVALKPTTISGKNLVVVGYGSQQEKNISGAISTVNSDQLNTVSTTSINQMLEGKVSGLNISQNSPQPGGAVSVNIRGAISPNGNNSPLYVIDGVPITDNSSSVSGLNNSDLGFYGGNDRDPLDYLDPSDIKSVTVLKGASAAAIYGSNAGNGVVLITTKDGQPGNVKVNYRGSFTLQKTHDYFPLLNAKEFMQQQNRLAHDRYLYTNSIAPYGTTDPSSVSPYNSLFSQSQVNGAGEGTNWFNQITRDHGYIDQQNLSLSGGSDHTTIYASFNYRKNNAVIKNSSLDKYTGHINVNQDIGNAINLGLKLTASQLNQNGAETGANDGGPEKYNLIQAANTYSPTVGIYNDEGDFASTFNPLVMNPAAFLTISDQIVTDHFLAIPKLEVDFTDHLKANVAGQIDINKTNRSFYLPRATNNAQLPDGSAQKIENRIDNYTSQGYLTYQNDFKNSSFKAVLGAGYYSTKNDGFTLQGVGYFTDAFKYNNVGVASQTLKNSISSYKNGRTKISQFIRLNYSLYDKYIFSFVGRRDGSSIFSQNHKYGYFPAGSVAWRIKQEKFLANVDPISTLKLRVGYGLAGNESVLSGNSLQLYNPGYPFLIGGTYYNGVALSQVANPDLSWEKDYSLSVGLDFGLFSNRITGSFDYYVKTVRDLLDYNPLPSNNAVGRVAANVGATRSKGIEISLHTKNIENQNVQWTSRFNVSSQKSEWLKRNPAVALPSYIHRHGRVDAIYGWETDGIIQSEDEKPSYMPDAQLGNIKYVDQNGDGDLNADDVVLLGGYAPKWMLGFSNTVSVRNFDLSVSLYSHLDFLVTNNFAPITANIDQATNPQNTTIYAKEIWSADNPNGTRPGVASNPYGGNNPTGNTDFDREDGSFLRIQNITLGYTLPVNALGFSETLRSARIFINAQDLGVLTNYNGYDPEYTGPNPYPKTYSATLGINLKF